ncbi:hypothetical protein SADUNF_Sadunf07G0080200 [Salix dunnii]|uniref:Major facilitator superfamily (MFS) profile domain-containing protein n=1 Tax=Salix dunnii TaxID=1413687 RepID=A0A835MZ69_9ROSI|nr:hypothetical protein SADUNF_Sadunf07G0080200 [Salix dunnii]
MKQETLTLVLVNFAGIMQRADESLLPGVYKEVGAALHADPTGLGSLTLFRSVVQSSSYPLAAYLAAHHNRAHVIALGAFLWAAATFLVAISSTYSQVAISRGLNGIGLAIVIPAIQSLVADSTDESNRGMAFGWLQLTGNLGSIIGNLCSVLLATTSFMGIAGWRVSFHLVGIISVVVGVLVRLFAKDPHFSDTDGRAKDKTPHTFISEFKDLIKDAKSVMKIPTFQIIVAQGVTGTFPWSGLSFAPMWLELIGFSHKQTASLLNIFVIGGSFGSLFGGRMGDILAKRLPNSGRVMLSQISAGSSIPLAGILLLVLPYDPSTAFMHGLVFFTMGLCTSWNAPATNNRNLQVSGILLALYLDYAKFIGMSHKLYLLQALEQKLPQLLAYESHNFVSIGAYSAAPEIVPERSRTTIYALDNSFETVLSSFAPPIVGILAQRLYGYKVPKTSSDSVKVETDRENAESLAKALFMSFVIPMSICVFIYSFLYWSYPRDRERAKMNALIESEMQQVEALDSPLEEEYSQLHLSESKGLDGKETTIGDVEYGKPDRLDFDDDSDNKALLSREDYGVGCLWRSCKRLKKLQLESCEENCDSLYSLLVYDGGNREGLHHFISSCRCDLKKLVYNEFLLDKEFISMLVSCNCLIELNLRRCVGLTTVSMVSIFKDCRKLQSVDIMHCDGIGAEAVELFCPQFTTTERSTSGGKQGFSCCKVMGIA